MLRAIIFIVLMGINLAEEMGVDIFGHSASIGSSHICAISQRNNNDDIGGQATCWHDGHKDRVASTAAPKEETFVQVISGSNFGCGLNIEQSVVCWGFYKDLEVPGIYTQISGADYYGCGIKTDSSIGCWGSMPKAPPTEGKYVQVDCHNWHCCALTTEGHPQCWGKHFEGDAHEHLKAPIDETKRRQLESLEEEEEDGYDDESNPDEAEAAIMKHTFAQLAVGDFFSCGITTEKHGLCWGEGRLSSDVPTHIPGPLRQISVGLAGVCAIYGKPAEVANAEGMPAEEEDAEEENAEGTPAEEENAEGTPAEEENAEGTPAEEENAEGRSEELPVENSMKCWGKGIKSVINMKEVQEEEWDQMIVGNNNACGITMNSELVCWGRGKEVANLPHGLVVA